MQSGRADSEAQGAEGGLGAGTSGVAGPKFCPSCSNRYAVDALFCPIDGTPLTNAASNTGPVSSDPYLGREILGHIEIRQLAGIGAMGRVYRAFQRGIDRDVAVKILHRELSTNQQLVSRFHREAKVASRLAHPNVVHVHLSGQLPDGAMYIVMEYLDGLSLQSALAAAGGAMPLPRALHVALQLCDATGEGHAQGVVHRDIKPENVMLVRRGDDEDYVKVLDFGIARLNWGEQSMATAAGLIFGTARYISPEGAQGEGVGAQGDVYAIGTLLFQMLAGRTPFEGDQAVALLVQQIHDPPPALRSIPRAAYVPEPIAQAIMKNLAKSPRDRDPDARAFGHALLEAAKTVGLSPEHLVTRPALLGGRMLGPTPMAPMARTRQLELSTEISERLAGAAPGPTRNEKTEVPPGKTAYETPANVATSEPPPRVAPGAATTKWTPPPGFQAQLAIAPSHADTALPPTKVSARAPTPSGVDITLDENDMVPPVPPSIARQPSSPSYDGGRAPATTSKPPSGVDSTLSDEEAAAHARRARLRSVLLVLGCFLLGVVGATAIAYRAGLVGSGAQTAALQAQVGRAEEALMGKRWDTPPGDNVRDITNEGLARWPNDANLIRIRALACDDIVKVARDDRRDGDLADALRLAKLANELDPTDVDAKALVASVSAELEQGTQIVPLAGMDAAVAPLTSARPSGSTAATAARATLDVSSSHPGLGQPVELVAHVIGSKRVDQASFAISGPGVAAGTRIPATSDDTMTFRASYAPFEAGRYEIVFSARADGVVLRAAHGLVAGDAPPPGPPPGPAPPPTASQRWM